MEEPRPTPVPICWTLVSQYSGFKIAVHSGSRYHPEMEVPNFCQALSLLIQASVNDSSGISYPSYC